VDCRPHRRWPRGLRVVSTPSGSQPAGNLMHMWYGTAGWGRPENLGGHLVGGVSAISWSLGRLDVFGEGADGTLQHIFYGAAGWSGFEALATGLTSAPSVASWAVGAS